MHCHSVILLRREFRLNNTGIRKDFGAGIQFLTILGWMSFCEALPQEEQYLVTLPVGGLAQLAWTSRNSSTDGKNISVWKWIKRSFHIWYSHTCQTLRPATFKPLNIPPSETGEVGGAGGSEGSFGTKCRLGSNQSCRLLVNEVLLPLEGSVMCSGVKTPWKKSIKRKAPRLCIQKTTVLLTLLEPKIMAAIMIDPWTSE